MSTRIAMAVGVTSGDDSRDHSAQLSSLSSHAFLERSGGVAGGAELSGVSSLYVLGPQHGSGFAVQADGYLFKQFVHPPRDREGV